MLTNFEHNIVWKLLKLLNFFTIYPFLLTVSWTHVIDVYLINQVSNKTVYISVLQTYPSSELLVTGLSPVET